MSAGNATKGPIPIPRGFRFGATAASFKYSGRDDLGLAVSEVPATAAGVFTQNLFTAAPVTVGRERVEGRGSARGVLANAGQANACTGAEGIADCLESLELAETAAKLPSGSLLPASTGVIGPRMDLSRWRGAMPNLVASLERNEPLAFAKAILTTDAFPKVSFRELPDPADPQNPEKTLRVLGVAKGAGMICPNMATMLCFVFTDGHLDPAQLQALLSEAVEATFNRVTVDGDTSTNDTVYLLANGQSPRAKDSVARDELNGAVRGVLADLARMLVADGEGASRIMRIRVTGAKDTEDAEKAARTIGHSPLVKTAMAGKDANWGRIAAALGRSGAAFTPEAATIAIGGVTVFAKGCPTAPAKVLDPLLAEVMRRQEIPVSVDLGAGTGSYELLASDLTHDYVSINADYRS